MSDYTPVTKTAASVKVAEKRLLSTADGSLFSTKTANSVLWTTPVRTRSVLSVEVGFGNGIAVCPVHGYAYDTKTGECQTDPRLRIRTYPVVVEDGEIKVDSSND